VTLNVLRDGYLFYRSVASRGAERRAARTSNQRGFVQTAFPSARRPIAPRRGDPGASSPGQFGFGDSGWGFEGVGAATCDTGRMHGSQHDCKKAPRETLRPEASPALLMIQTAWKLQAGIGTGQRGPNCNSLFLNDRNHCPSPFWTPVSEGGCL
jgi:hypothetical protein